MILKFRAWYTPSKDKAIGRETKYGQAGRLITHAEMAPDKYVFMRSVGLKDKDGVGIFEGDIASVGVRNGSDHLDNKICTAKNSVGYSGLVCVIVSEGLGYQTFNTESFKGYTYEIIGNIYENSESLEVK